MIVAAAVVERDGMLLITRRPDGTHLEGYWEFPGGKCEAGEALVDCLRRELREELGTDADVGEEILAVTHSYPERTVELHFFACRLHAEPRPLLQQEMRWAGIADLATLRFPPADDELITLLLERRR